MTWWSLFTRELIFLPVWIIGGYLGYLTARLQILRRRRRQDWLPGGPTSAKYLPVIYPGKVVCNGRSSNTAGTSTSSASCETVRGMRGEDR